MDPYKKQHNFLLQGKAQWATDAAVEIGTAYSVDGYFHRFAAVASNGAWAYGVKKSGTHDDNMDTSLCRGAMEFRAVFFGLQLCPNDNIVLHVSPDILSNLKAWGEGSTYLPKLDRICGFSRVARKTYAQVAMEGIQSHSGGIGAVVATSRQLCVVAAEEVIRICSRFRFSGKLGVSYESRQVLSPEESKMYLNIRDGFLTYQVNAFLDLLWPEFTPGRRVQASFATKQRAPQSA